MSRDYYDRRGDIYLDALLEARELVREQAPQLFTQVSDLITAAIAKAAKGGVDD